MERHITATEVKMRQELSDDILNEIRSLICDVWLGPMYTHIFSMYNIHEGRKRIDRYASKMIKTM